MVVATIMMMVGCTGNGGTQQEEQPQDTVYTQEAAMKVYDYDPVRALRIVDSAVIVGNLSDWRADKNRARIVCILLAVALAALAWYFRQMRIVKQKNRALVRQIDEALRYKELFHEGNTHAVDTAANLKSSGAFKNLSEIVCKSVCAIAGADFFVYLRSQ